MITVELKNGQVVKGLNKSERELLKESVTFNNPSYAKAKRYARNPRYISIPTHLNYYREYSEPTKSGERAKVLEVPIGVNVKEVLRTKKIKYIDKRVTHEVVYPKFALTLRKDQERAERSYLDQVKGLNVNSKCIVQLPTGKGKSILALHIASVLQQRTLVLVHKKDLVSGWKKDIELCFKNKADVGLIQGKSRNIGKHITIATVQTLSRMDKDEFNTFIDQFGFVVQDEFHHLGINMFNIISAFNSKYKIGLSATPKREDGYDFTFKLFLGGIGFKYEYDPKDKDICKVKVITKTARAKYKPFIHSSGVFNYYDYSEDQLPRNLVFVEDLPYKERPRVPFLEIDNNLVSNRKTKIMVCKDILKEYRQGRSCLALFTQKDHIRQYYNYLCMYMPKDKIMCYYGDSKEDSSVLMERAESKEVLVTLGTYAKTTEGTNVKSWEVLFLVSSLNNEKNVEQATGRIRRSKEGKIDPVLVYDYRYEGSYSVSNHGYTRDRVYKMLKYDYNSRTEKTDYKETRNRSFSKGYGHRLFDYNSKI